MINIKKKTQLFIALSFLNNAHFLKSIAPINIARPFDETYLFDPVPFSKGDFNILYEQSTSIKAAQDIDDNDAPFLPCKVNVLQIYQSQQDVLAALKGFKLKSLQGQIAQRFTQDDDNNNRGHLVPCGDLSVKNLLLTARCHFCSISLTAALPYNEWKLKNINWKDLTNFVTPEDILAHQLLTDNLSKNIKNLGCIDTNSWKRKGFGDLYIGSTWHRIIPQTKPFLNCVGLSIQGGFSLPTGKRRNEDKILAFEFGNDGCTGIVASGSLDLTFARYLRGGFTALVLYLFGNTRDRRIAIDPLQTDLLLFKKLKTYKKPGLTQLLTLYGELSRIAGFSLQMLYQQFKHDEDKIFICSDRFYQPVANNAVNLQEWTVHSLIFKAKYEPDYVLYKRKLLPAFELFYKTSFNGKNALLLDSVGAQLSLSF